MFSNNINEQYIDKLYDNFQREHIAMLNDIKSGCSEQKQADIIKQIAVINSILTNILKLRNIKKRISNNINS